MTRHSVESRPSNRYVVTAQLDAATHAKMQEILKATGMSRSRLFRVLITGSRINVNTRSKAKEGDDE